MTAPAALVVEIRAQEHTDERRAFRLSRELGEAGLRLERPAPFEPGRPVTVSFSVPDAPAVLTVRAEVALTGDDAEADGENGGAELRFTEPPADVRATLHAYIAQRLGLPGL